MYNDGIKADDVEYLEHYTDVYTSSGHLYLVRLLGKDSDVRNAFITKMAENGIATNVHFKPLPMHTAYKELGFNIVDYPNSYEMYHNEVTLPLHTNLTDEQVEYVIENFNNIKRLYSFCDEGVTGEMEMGMQLRRWNSLPDVMKTKEVRKYYNIIKDVRVHLS